MRTWLECEACDTYTPEMANQWCDVSPRAKVCAFLPLFMGVVHGRSSCNQKHGLQTYTFQSIEDP